MHADAARRRPYAWNAEPRKSPHLGVHRVTRRRDARDVVNFDPRDARLRLEAVDDRVD